MRLKAGIVRALMKRSADRGFSLVELMVVVAIVAILAAVAIPAYINYINRMKQSEAGAFLNTARLELEEYYADNNYYPSTIGCLASFNYTANAACLTSCTGCTQTTSRQKYYTYKVTTAGAYYSVGATRLVRTGQTDTMYISSLTTSPTVTSNASVMGYSLYQWLFK